MPCRPDGHDTTFARQPPRTAVIPPAKLWNAALSRTKWLPDRERPLGRGHLGKMIDRVRLNRVQARRKREMLVYADLVVATTGTASKQMA
jgi:hypothetical protein